MYFENNFQIKILIIVNFGKPDILKIILVFLEIKGLKIIGKIINKWTIRYFGFSFWILKINGKKLIKKYYQKRNSTLNKTFFGRNL